MTRTADPYAVLGVSYAASRQPDPRIAATIRAALGGARTVVNVGAGAGSYEPADVRLTAVEPSAVMIGQRPLRAAPAVRAVAEQLPFPDDAFDAALAVLTVHHWRSASAGLAELRRVARAQVVLTWDPEITSRFWLLTDYLPQIPAHERGLACLDAVCAGLRAPGPAGAGGSDEAARGQRAAGAGAGRLHGRLPRRLLAATRGLPAAGGAGRDLQPVADRPGRGPGGDAQAAAPTWPAAGGRTGTPTCSAAPS